MSASAVLDTRAETRSRPATFADLINRIGDVPSGRIRLNPPPGTATVQDVIDVEAREGRLCELIAGTLVEKAVGYLESEIAGAMLDVLRAYVRPRKTGIVSGPDGMMEILNEVVRIPDVAFASWHRFPGKRRPRRKPVPAVVPDLVVEVLSESNRPSEMAAKRTEYFLAGIRLYWEIDPEARVVTVYTSPTDSRVLKVGDTLDGGDVLPEFHLSLAEFFSEFDEEG